MRALFGMFAVLGLIFAGQAAQAEDDSLMPEYTLVIKDHTFTPAELEVPAGKRIKLTIDNQDPTPEEFESHKMKAEKIIPGNSKGIVFVGPLKPGAYTFFGEFNEDKARGKVIAK